MHFGLMCIEPIEFFQLFAIRFDINPIRFYPSVLEANLFGLPLVMPHIEAMC